MGVCVLGVLAVAGWFRWGCSSVPASRLSTVALLGASDFGPDGIDDLGVAPTSLHCWVFLVSANQHCGVAHLLVGLQVYQSHPFDVSSGLCCRCWICDL